MRDALKPWIPPAKAVRVVAILLALVAAVAIVGLWWGGTDVAIASVLGSLSVLLLALKRPPWWHTVALACIAAAGSAAATMLTDSAWGLGIIVAGTVVAATPLVLRHGAIVSLTPVVVVLAGTQMADIGPLAAAVGILAAGLLMVLGVALLGLTVPSPPPPALPVLLAYVGALALGSGAVVVAVVSLGLAHGYWVVIALTAVLVPVAGETTRMARERIVGTVVGAILASALALVLPAPVALVAAAASLLLGMALTIIGAQARGVALVAVAIVLLSSGGAAGSAWEVAGERALLTLVGGVVAVVLALAIARFDRREESSAVIDRES